MNTLSCHFHRNSLRIEFSSLIFSHYHLDIWFVIKEIPRCEIVFWNNQLIILAWLSEWRSQTYQVSFNIAERTRTWKSLSYYDTVTLWHCDTVHKSMWRYCLTSSSPTRAPLSLSRREERRGVSSKCNDNQHWSRSSALHIR